MSLDLLVTAIGSRLLEWDEALAAQLILEGLESPFKVSDLQPVLKSSLMAAHRREKHLFKTDERSVIHNFLDRIFQANSVIIQDLKKPFLGNYNLQESTLQQEIELLLEHEPDPPINTAHFQLWIKVFIRHYLQEINALGYKVGKRSYLSQLSQLSDRNLFAVPYELKKIFVLPDVAEEIRLVTVRVKENSEEERTITRTRSHQKFSAELILKLIHSHQIVIVGNIGSGKTTLLDYFCLILSNPEVAMSWGFELDNSWLPILINAPEICEYTQDIDHLSLWDYLRNQTLKRLQLENLPADFFEYWLQECRALILVDGLSNIANPETQRKLSEKIAEFLRDYQHNPCLITVRSEGYNREILQTQELPHYYLEDFQESQVQQLVKKWYGEYAQSTLLTNPEENVELLRHEAVILRYLLEQNGWEKWRNNPFLLTAFLLAVPGNKPFPKTRSEIGSLVLPILFECWSDCPPLPGLTVTDLPHFIKELAVKMHTQNLPLLSQEQLIETLTESIIALKKQEESVAQNNTILLVEYLSKSLGIFNRNGEDSYGFIDSFFPSLLVAKQIKDQQQKEGWEIIFTYIQTYLYQPNWQEILLLLIADQPVSSLPQIIQFILDLPNPYEFCFHENLFFICHCLGENIALNDPDLVKKILSQLAQLVHQDGYEIGHHVRAAMPPIILQLKQTQFWEIFTHLLTQPVPEEWTHPSPVETGRNPQEQQQHLGTLINQLKSPKPEIRAEVIKELGKIETPPDSIIQTLLMQFQDQDPQVRANAVEAIGHMEQHHPDVILPLMALLQDPSFLVRANAVQALGHQGEPTESIIYPLLSLLQDPEAIVRASVVQTLGHWPQQSTLLIPPILSMLNDSSSWVRSSAAIAAAQLEPKSASTLGILLNLSQDGDLRVKTSVVEALGILGEDSPQVIETLFSLLQKDPAPEIQTQAALALIKLGQPQEKVTDFIIQFLQENKQVKGLGIFIDTLWQLVHASNKN